MLNQHQSGSTNVLMAVVSLSIFTNHRPSVSTPFNEVLGFMASSRAEGRSNEKAETSTGDSPRKAFAVLVVDDDDGFRKALVNSLLALTGIEVSTDETDTGEHTITKLKDAVNSFDVIFLDLILPKMSGLETRAEIKKLNVASRIVMMTSAPDSEVAKAARQQGFKVHDKEKIFLELMDILFGNSGDSTDE
jgi:CheY-like chemotaxis protein